MTDYHYLAGPMSGLPLFNFPAFRAAREDLRARGIAVYCPAEADELAGFDPTSDPADDLAVYMRRDLAAVAQSAGVIVLPGWRASAGVQREVTVAGWCGLPILEYPDLTPVQPESILLEAERIVHGPRRSAYGHPLDNFERAALLMGAWLSARGLLAPGAVLTPEDTAALMIQGKLARQCNLPTRDNIVDTAGYAAAWQAVIDERARRQGGQGPCE